MSKSIEIIKLGNISPSKWGNATNQGRVYSPDGLCPTLDSMQGGGGQTTARYSEKMIPCATRTRNYCGQAERLEVRWGDSSANSITTVQKDSMVLEIKNEQTNRSNGLQI